MGNQNVMTRENGISHFNPAFCGISLEMTGGQIWKVGSGKRALRARFPLPLTARYTVIPMESRLSAGRLRNPLFPVFNFL
jgi:hypothetical protein